jgi:hypothetical protein
MKNLLLGAFCLLVTTFAFSQDAVSGYYITTGGQKVTGEYEYGNFSSAENLKFRTGTGEFSKPDPKNIKEYGVGESYKYVKYTVDIDVDDATPERPGNSSVPMFEKRELFLNVLAEGDAVLYSYSAGGSTKYFYKTGQMLVPQQLVYRAYTVAGGKIAENNEYIIQISKNLVCNGMNDRDVSGLKYSKYALVKFFEAYSACTQSNLLVYNNELGRKLRLVLSVFAGVHYFSFNLVGQGVPSLEKDTGLNYSAGGEMELLLPSDKLGIFIRAEAEYLDAEVAEPFEPGAAANPVYTRTYYFYNTRTTFINASIGPRYYFKLNDKNKLFADASAVVTVGTGSLEMYGYNVSTTTVYPAQYIESYSLGGAVSFNFGLGYTFNNRFTAEARINTQRNVQDRFPLYSNIEFFRTGINLRYSFK